MKKASRGFGIGKWNAPGGKIEPDENALSSARREVHEETGLTVNRLFHHGTVRYFMNGSKILHTRGHIFSTETFSGKARSTVEGRVRWFRLDEIPFELMWDDDKYWLGLMLSRSRFDADFYYSRDNNRVVSHRMTIRHNTA